MSEMTTYERYTRMFQHREADRIPVLDTPWRTTLERWQCEGLPANVDYRDFFDLDHVVEIKVDNSPRFPVNVIAETDDHIIYQNPFGVTIKEFKHSPSTFQFLDVTITDRISWDAARQRIQPSLDRVDWDFLRKNYKAWRQQGAWIEAVLSFGFDVTHSWIVGTERTLTAMAQDPEWLMDIFGVMLETNLTLLDKVWDEGYHFDSIIWSDDLGYKEHTFFSLKMYREVIKPFHKRAIEWAHAKGIKARLHSCGYVAPLIPDFLEIGLDALNPLEVKAGMDTLQLKQDFGDRLVLHGGINAVYYDQPEMIQAELKKKIPILKQNGGYIFSSDHSVPDSVSLQDFRQIIEWVKNLGSYT